MTAFDVALRPTRCASSGRCSRRRPALQTPPSGRGAKSPLPARWASPPNRSTVPYRACEARRYRSSPVESEIAVRLSSPGPGCLRFPARSSGAEPAKCVALLEGRWRGSASTPANGEPSNPGHAIAKTVRPGAVYIAEGRPGGARGRCGGSHGSTSAVGSPPIAGRTPPDLEAHTVR